MATDAFSAIFPKLVEQFVSYNQNEFDLSEDNVKRLRWLLEYNCLGGKGYRASLAISTTKQACEAKGLNFADYEERALVLGWCVEVLQACFLVADDIMDASTTRRGKPCWYMQPTIKMDAVNDSLILETFMYFLLRQYFRKDADMYLRLLDIFQDVCHKTQMGQMLDLTSQPQGRKGPDVLKGFSVDLHKKIVKFKTAFYTFYLPLASGLILCGYDDDNDFNKARDICMELGEKFQIQDDYLDCYGDPELIGKIGTDIQDHKCSWLCVQALLKMTPEQRTNFENWYGKEDEESVANVKNLFNELKLVELYNAQEETSLRSITAKIEEATKTMPDIFSPILKRIHNRQK